MWYQLPSDFHDEQERLEPDCRPKRQAAGGVERGVFALAMTQLVLDLDAPVAAATHGEHDLWRALVALNPRLVMYLMIFLTLGLFWVGQQTPCPTQLRPRPARPRPRSRLTTAPLECDGDSSQNSRMARQFTTSYLTDAIAVLRYYKKLGDRAIEQAPDEALAAALDPESNSIAIIVKHMAGNMKSRWTDFFISDGEKSDRNRDTEFEEPPRSREELMRMWETGWGYVFTAVDSLTESDLARTVTIRSEPHSVMQAINRQLAHYAYHVGQIVYLSRHFAGDRWQTLTVPRGKSAEYNAKMAARERPR